ncbi:hypothetical protein [Microbulbifer hydrolyticus]|uniref:Membrane protein YdbS with pleckstrin-like domain n=1 Tax=Microbulbifer hydrolyticus TaxID=48074 RepID=A0A6P1TA08_9GAMM|nr:hypothetical protein [Microbulbifer hydrolyticus]MBB5213298.1 membrane protein YdbS with pleckstrin-like domain [Microbulbifer hydrolyticus]QHQ38585.1 hypothetical protein GTQ55_06025 [Microbulbifer hydrolyticus]
MFSYKNLRSENLKPLLVVVKILHFISIAVLALVPICIIPGMYIGFSVPYILSFAVYAAFGIILAGLLASLVAFEESYRQRTVHLEGARRDQT